MAYPRYKRIPHTRQGSRTASPVTPTIKSALPSTFGYQDGLKSWIENYRGNNPYLDSFKLQLQKFGQLSQKQWSIINREAQKAAAPTKPAAVKLAPTIITPGVPVLINRTAAFREIRDKLGLEYGIFAVKINSVLNAGSARNGNKWAELEVTPDVDSPVSCCRICGKTLTDQRSIVSGIGPDCAKKFGKAAYITYKQDVQKFMNIFKASMSKVGTIQIKLWANQVKHNVVGFTESVNFFLNQTVPTTPAVQSTAPVSAPAWKATADPVLELLITNADVTVTLSEAGDRKSRDYTMKIAKSVLSNKFYLNHATGEVEPVILDEIDRAQSLKVMNTSSGKVVSFARKSDTELVGFLNDPTGKFSKITLIIVP